MKVTIDSYDNIITSDVVKQLDKDLKDSHEFFQSTKDLYSDSDKIREAIDLHLQAISEYLKSQNIEPAQKKEAPKSKAKPKAKATTPDKPEKIFPYCDLFMGKHQKFVLKEAFENEEYYAICQDLESRLAQIKATDQPKGADLKDCIVYARYFAGGSSNWYITSVNKRDRIAFGFAVLNGDMINAEFGSIGLDEITGIQQVELDFYYDPVTVREALANDGHTDPHEVKPGNKEEEAEELKEEIQEEAEQRAEVIEEKAEAATTAVAVRPGRKRATKKPSVKMKDVVEITAGRHAGKIAKVANTPDADDRAVSVVLEDGCTIASVKLDNLKKTRKKYKAETSEETPKKSVTSVLTKRRKPRKKTTAKKSTASSSSKTSSSATKKTTTRKRKTTTKAKPKTTRKATTSRKSTTKAKPKTTRKKASTKKQESPAKKVEQLSMATKVARRIKNLHDKQIGEEHIERIVRAMHKADLAGEFKGEDKATKDVLNAAQRQLINFHKSMKGREKFTIHDSLLEKVVDIAEEEVVRPSVRLLNSYYGLLGTDKHDSMERLIKRIENAIDKGKVRANDKYMHEVKSALRSLKKAVGDKSELLVRQVQLSGIEDILQRFGFKKKI